MSIPESQVWSVGKGRGDGQPRVEDSDQVATSNFLFRESNGHLVFGSDLITKGILFYLSGICL